VAPGPDNSGRCGNAPRDLTGPALSPDGTRLLTVGYADRTPWVALWDTRSGEVLRTWTSDEYVSAAGFAADGLPVIQAGSELVVLGEVPRFVAHGLKGSEYDPATSEFLVHAPGGYAWVDPASGAVTPTTGPEPTEEDVPRPLTAISADGSVRVVVGRDGVARFERLSSP
jgi:hypothetical protein